MDLKDVGGGFIVNKFGILLKWGIVLRKQATASKFQQNNKIYPSPISSVKCKNWYKIKTTKYKLIIFKGICISK